MVALIFSYSSHAAWDIRFPIHFSLPWIRARSLTTATALSFSDSLTLICLIPGLKTTQSPHSLCWLITSSRPQITLCPQQLSQIGQLYLLQLTDHMALPLLQQQKLQSNAKLRFSDPKDLHGRSMPSPALFHMQSCERTSHLDITGYSLGQLSDRPIQQDSET